MQTATATFDVLAYAGVTAITRRVVARHAAHAAEIVLAEFASMGCDADYAEARPVR